MKVLSIVVLLILSGCEFSKKRVDGSLDIGSISQIQKMDESRNEPVGKNHVIFDWGSLSDSNEKKYFKGKRNLREERYLKFYTTEPITIPIDSPESLEIEIVLEGKRDLLSTYKVDSDLKVKEDKTRLIVKSYQVNFNEDTNQTRIKISITGLRSLFKISKSESGIIEIIFYDEFKKMIEFSLRLRLPPSEVTVESFSQKELKNVSDRGLFPDYKIEINGSTYFVLGEIHIQNNEDYPISFRMNRKEKLSLVRDKIRYFWVNHECHSTYSESSEIQVLSSDIRFVHYSDNVLFEIENLYIGSDDRRDILITIPAKSKRVFGIISQKENLENYFYHNLEKPSSYSQSRVVGCTKQCVSMDCEPRCVCNEWANVPQYGTGDAGVKFSEVRYSGNTVIPYKIKYADLPLDRGDEERYGEFTLSWRGL